MKSQADVMEYLVLVIMIMLIAFFVLLLVFGFQLFTAGSEQAVAKERRSLFLLQSIISSNMLNNPQYQTGSVFDDSKLTVIKCEDIEKLFGEDAWINITVLKDESVCDNFAQGRKRNCIKVLKEEANIPCATSNYPKCNIWTLCEKNTKERMIYRSIPVNIHRKINGMIELGVLTVGVPGGA